jgi:predicted RNA-binding protein YlqC (UPF0109 family)
VADQPTDATPAFEQPDFSRFDSEDEAGELEVEDFGDNDDDPQPEIEAPRAAGRPVDEGNARVGGIAADVLEHIATSIVDEKESVVVETRPGRGQIRLNLHVAPGDMGRIIGRRGRTARAVRTLVRAAAAAEGQDAFVDIVD